MNPTHSFHINLMTPVQINYHGRVFNATMGSLTPEGALLETHGLTLPTGMQVELSVTIGREPWLVRALVTHTTPYEIGLMFKHSQHKLFSAARNDTTLAFCPPVQAKKTDNTISR